MNKIKIRNYQIFSIIFIFLLGSLLHFTYNISGQNQIVAIFSSINESVWEHLKLLYFPMLLTIIIGWFYLDLDKENPNFLCAKTIGVIISIMFTVIFFYTYSGVLGKNIAIIDITSFFISTVLGEFIAYLLMINRFKCNNKVYKFILIIIFVLFIIFTYYTPKLGIFKNPVTANYGIIDKK